MIKVDQISLKINYTNEDILFAICKALNIQQKDIKNFELAKLAIDARKKPNIKYVANIIVELNGNLENKFAKLKYQPSCKTSFVATSFSKYPSIIFDVCAIIRIFEFVFLLWPVGLFY